MLASEETLALLKESILLPMTLTLLDRERKALLAKKPQLQLAELYAIAVERIMDMVTQDLTTARMKLRQMGVKLYEIERDVRGISFMYVLKGYQYEINMLWSYVKPELDVRIGTYAKLLEEALQRSGPI